MDKIHTRSRKEIRESGKAILFLMNRLRNAVEISHDEVAKKYLGECLDELETQLNSFSSLLIDSALTAQGVMDDVINGLEEAGFEGE